MRNALLITFVLALLFVFMGCGGSSPITPGQPKFADQKITLDFKDYYLDQLNMPSGSMHNPQGDIVVPGTDMTYAEQRIYWSVGFTSANFPKAYADKYCNTYKIFKAYFDKQPDSYMDYMVTWEEGRGWNVLNEDEALAAGLLTPICN